MKKISYLLTIFIFVLTIFNIKLDKKTQIVYAQNSATISMEISSKRVLTGTNIHTKMYMASTTKILTAITVIENCNLDDVVTVTAKSVGVEGSSMYLDAGEKITVKNLLYGLMLRSGNDAATTLALYACGSIEKFAELMNCTAKKAGAKESNFVNPHGLHNDNHYTTAYDLALISCYAMQNEVFKEIVGTRKITIPWTTRDYDRTMVNKNKMLSNYEGATGIKTGYTKKAGRCLVSSAKRNGMDVVTVVLNCGNMWEKSTELLDYSFENYNMKKLVEADHVIGFIDIENSEEKCAVITDKDIILPLSEQELLNLKIEYNYPKIIKPPYNKKETVGEIKIYTSNNLIFLQKIYTIIGMN